MKSITLFSVIKKKRLLFLILVTSFFNSSYALANTIVFQCTTKNNKQLLVTLNKNLISYKFGRNLSNPEMALTTKQVTYMPWTGVSSMVNNSLEIQNGNIKYTVFSSYQRDPNNLNSQSGIVVSKGDQELATVYCKESSKGYVNNLDDSGLLSQFKKD
ncbi:hypothetical protein E0H77_09555 [Acinetobacter sp. ANC 4633]|uniref:hypothetical protein n=1 Tax=Acinetobacter sp. ANC 4633 TaxID=2529845 RepID=UPI001038E4E9|nr:hypothetical protein [Acinetobacter sp. ANC 4633]TCB25308.1 hypothetical protein E0H77_09555 [Acinetobacter sp. ANC 4633]